MRALLPFLLLISGVLGSGAETGDRGPLNQHGPDWVDLHASARFRAEEYQGVDFEQDNERGFVLQRYRFSSGFRVAPWMQLFGEMQDAREIGGPNPGAGLKDSLDLRQAWVRLGTESGHWDLTAGRQMLAFGAERLVGAGEWGNTARVFDAVRLGLHQGDNRVDLFSSSVVRNDVDGWDHHVDGDDLHGAYATLSGVLPKIQLEPYLLYRTAPSFRSSGVSGPYDSWSYGFRATNKEMKKWGYEVETLAQHGEIGAARLRGWAFTAIGQRNWGSVRWTPSAVVEYSFASGDKNLNDALVQTVDQLYPTNHGKYGVVDQIGRRNMKDFRIGFGLHPLQKLALKAEGHAFRLASRFDALYSAGGAVSIPAVAGGAASTDVGREVDVLGDFRISKHYDLGLQVGHLFPGAFVRTYSPGVGKTFYTIYLDLRI